MNTTRLVLLPKLQTSLKQMGEQIKLARLRRKYTAEQVAERSNLGRNTVWQIEKGAASVSIGAYLQVLFVLGLEDSILELAAIDPLGRKLQDAELTTGKRAPKQNVK